MRVAQSGLAGFVMATDSARPVISGVVAAPPTPLLMTAPTTVITAATTISSIIEAATAGESAAASTAITDSKPERRLGQDAGSWRDEYAVPRCGDGGTRTRLSATCADVSAWRRP